MNIWDPEAFIVKQFDSAEGVDSGAVAILFQDENIDFAVVKKANNSITVLGNQAGDSQEIDGDFLSLKLNRTYAGFKMNIDRAYELTFKNLDGENGLVVYALLVGLFQLTTKRKGEVPLEALRKLVSGHKDTKVSTEEVGLFGELCFLAKSVSLEKGIKGWHPQKSNSFDFIIDKVRFEVKTTLGSRRRHWISWNQTSRVGEFELKYVSVRSSVLGVEGMSCGDLVEILKARCGDAQSRTSFEKIVGQYDLNLFRTKFDFDQAMASLEVFDPESLELPLVSSPGILAAKWLVDFEGAV